MEKPQGVTAQELIMSVAGIVLCGGHSSRMGRPKAWLPIGGEAMLTRVVRIVGEVTDPVVAVAAPGQELPPLPPRVEVVRDEEEGRGPLQGLVAGLSSLQGRADAAYLSSCDVPLLVPAFIERLVERLGTDSICVPRIAGIEHPLAGVYRIDILARASELLARRSAGPSALLGIVPTRFVEVEELTDVDPTLRSLRNVNTPEDYEAALRDVVGE